MAIDEPLVYPAVAIGQLMPSGLGLAVRLSLARSERESRPHLSHLSELPEGHPASALRA
jgi:hypothetical protein